MKPRKPNKADISPVHTLAGRGYVGVVTEVYHGGRFVDGQPCPITPKETGPDIFDFDGAWRKGAK